MMVETSGYEPEVAEDNEQSSFQLPDLVQRFGKKNLVGCGLIAIAAIGFIANGGEKYGNPITTKTGNAVLTSQTIEMSSDPEQASFLLRTEQLESGLIQEQAQQFIGAAINFQNQADHYCAGKTLELCLISFQKNRADQILQLTLSQDGNRDTNSTVAKLLFDIKAIELAIASQSDNDIATQAFLDASIKHPEVKTAPVATFLEAFKDHRNRKQLNHQLNQEMLQTEFAGQRLDQCRQSGGSECF